MTTYYAVVKYALDDPPERKITALRDGLAFIAAELVAEHGCDIEDVTDWLERAQAAADYATLETARG